MLAWRLIMVTQILATKYGALCYQLCSRRLAVEEAWSHLTRKCTRYYCKRCCKKLWL